MSEATIADHSQVWPSEPCRRANAILFVWRVDDGFVGEVRTIEGSTFGQWSDTKWRAGRDAWLCWDEAL